MKKIYLIVVALCFISCEKEIDDILNDYKTKPKSDELQGFWQLKGTYPVLYPQPTPTGEITLGQVSIYGDEILYLDHEYLRLLKKTDNTEYDYTYSKTNRMMWYNDDRLIHSVYEDVSNSKNYQNIVKYQLPYRFGRSKDTLVVQNNYNTYYLIKVPAVTYEEYTPK